MPLSNYAKNKLVDHLLRAQTFTPPATIYIALYTTATDDDAAGTEVTGGSYARAAVTSSLAEWAGTQGAGTTAASSGSSGQSSNNNTIVFPAPTANWGTVTHMAAYDALTGGNRLFHKALSIPRVVNNGDPAPSFPVAALTVTFTNP